MSILNALSISRRTSAAFVIVGLFWGCFAAYVPVIKAQLGVNDAVFGMLLLGSAMGLLSAVWLAPHVDRVLGARGMQAGALAMAVVWLVPAHITVPVLFGLMMVLVGMSSGLLDVVMNARVSELEARHDKSLMNANHAMFSVGYAAAAFASGFLREAGISPAIALGCFSVLTLLLIPFLRLDVTVTTPETGSQHKYPLWPILICGGIVLTAFMSEAATEAWSALHVERTLGGGAAQGALGPAMLGLTMAIGRFSGQLVAARLHEVQVVIWAGCLSSAGAVIAALAPTPTIAYLGFGVLGLGVSVIGPMGLALVGKSVPAHLRTEAISRAAVIGFAGFFFAPVLMGGVSHTFGLRIAFLCVAVLLLSSVPLAIKAAKLPRP